MSEKILEIRHLSKTFGTNLVLKVYILYYFQQYQWQYQLFHLSILGR